MTKNENINRCLYINKRGRNCIVNCLNKSKYFKNIRINIKKIIRNVKI